DCGAVYLKDGTPQDPFVILQTQGASLVRARLWHTPDWTTYSTLEDVIKTFGRAKQQGMATLLAVHYSDNWADPGRQEIPAAWVSLDELQLVEAVYQYTYEVLVTLDEVGLVPDFIQVGNETNSGLLKQAVGLDWPRDAALFNAGIQAIRDFSAAAGHHPQIVLHVAQPENTGWWFREAESAGVTDFDVIGVSYYPQWSTFSIADMGAQVSYLRQQFGKEVMVVEAAYPWTREAVDETADNILNQGRRGYPITLEGQRQFMIDLTQSLISNGALGIVYWEPAWVSTSCFTRWGQGSHWENAALFDFQQELHAGADFLNHDYLYPAEIVDGEIEAGYGDPLVQDGTADVLENSAALDLAALYAYKQDETLYLAITVNGSILAERGNYLIYLDTTHDTAGASIDVGSRPITAAD
ncbi:MAG: arabinogalactan endo-1,4-beta-galactosidase, partial [Anaerolineae bacterium]|nr:arabinogalactan endo-1,4-beta-galactosidase [Anaerolineae bacterium]